MQRMEGAGAHAFSHPLIISMIRNNKRRVVEKRRGALDSVVVMSVVPRLAIGNAEVGGR